MRDTDPAGRAPTTAPRPNTEPYSRVSSSEIGNLQYLGNSWAAGDDHPSIVPIVIAPKVARNTKRPKNYYRNKIIRLNIRYAQGRIQNKLVPRLHCGAGPAMGIGLLWSIQVQGAHFLYIHSLKDNSKNKFLKIKITNYL